MEETQGQAPGMSPVEPPEEEVELNHTDKIVGVFSEPGNTFASIAKTGAKTSDWLIPLFLLIAVLILSTVVKFSNPQVKMEMMQQTEKQMQEMVDNGTLTQEQADTRMEQVRQLYGGPIGIIFASISIIFGFLIAFFVIATAFFIAAKFILKGDGSYKDALTAYGLPYYIAVIQAIVAVILSVALGKYFENASVASFMDVQQGTIISFLLGKLDVFSIWFYAVLSISLAKMFKSQSTAKYYAMVFGMWIGFGLIFFFLGKSVPFLAGFAR